MSEFDLTGYSALSQIFLTIITFLGIVISMWFSMKALREVQTDRRLRQKPFLAFEPGGFLLPIDFVKAGKTIPGLNPDYVKKVFANIPDDAESIRLKREEGAEEFAAPPNYGHLKNYGAGPALSTKVTWIPKKIRIGSEEFVVDKKKLLEPPYQDVLNTMPTVPSHILPGEEAELSRLPTFIEKDIEKKVTEVVGILEIECEDLFTTKHLVMQEFRIATEYKKKAPHIEAPYLIVTFGDLVETHITPS